MVVMYRKFAHARLNATVHEVNNLNVPQSRRAHANRFPVNLTGENMHEIQIPIKIHEEIFLKALKVSSKLSYRV